MLIIDWKYFATTQGYKSLKAAYVCDVQEAAKQKHPIRKKAEFLTHFNWVVSRAKHYAYELGVPIEVVLDDWEEKRTCWWLSYYQEYSQPKLNKGNTKKPMGIKGFRKSHKSSWLNTPQNTKHRVCKLIQDKQHESSTKIKPRWTKAQRR